MSPSCIKHGRRFFYGNARTLYGLIAATTQRRFYRVPNSLKLAEYDYKHEQLVAAKQLRQQKEDTLTQAHVDSDSQPIRSTLDQLKQKRDSKQILRTITEYAHQTQHIDCSVFGKAIKNCGALRDHHSCRQIMNVMLQQIVKHQKSAKYLNSIVFTIFFNEMCRADLPLLAQTYFTFMTQDLKIVPSVVCFAVLIKSCKEQRLIQLAETYWKLMEDAGADDPGVTPNIICYTEMISCYSRAPHQEQQQHVQISKAVTLFEECVSKLSDDDKQSTQMLVLLGAMLSCYSRNGDLRGMKRMVKMVKEFGFALNEVLYSDLMRGCIVARKPLHVLKFYSAMMKNKIRPNASILYLYGLALYNTIAVGKTLSFDEKMEIHQLLLQHNRETYKKYGIPTSVLTQHTEFVSTIVLYHNVDPQKIVRTYEEMLSNGSQMHYKRMGTHNVIDLHSFDIIVVQFFLRYIVGYKLHEFFGSDRSCDVDELVLVVGKGKHSKYPGISMKPFVIEELSRFEPPIKAHTCEHAHGRVLVPKQELLPYLNCEQNYAAEKLTIPSTDWYLDDPRL